MAKKKDPKGASSRPSSRDGRASKTLVVDVEDLREDRAGWPDTIELDEDRIEELLEERNQAIFRIYETLEDLNAGLDEYFTDRPEILPPSIEGMIVNVDGSPASSVWVEALEPNAAVVSERSRKASPDAPWETSRARTDARGAFALQLSRRPIPEQGLRLRVTGANQATETLVAQANLVTGTGSVGTLALSVKLAPTSAKMFGPVVALSDEDVACHPRDFVDPTPVVTLGGDDCGGCGEDGGCGCEDCADCARSFRSNSGVVDRFGFSMLIRLCAPNMTKKHVAPFSWVQGSGLVFYAQLAEELGGTPVTWDLVSRIPIETPVDVDGFLRDTQTNPQAVRKASTLALGYIVRMHQIWIPTGLSLGDLVYSLPLAPGEQQRIAVSEERESLNVREAESLSADEYQHYAESGDSSTNAVFNSAFREAARGGNAMATVSAQASAGVATGAGGMVYGILMGGGFSAGFSASTAAGVSSSWQSTSRDFVSNAAQDFHSHLARQAAARRQSSRTGMRLASASESQAVTSKVISNHNHCHALTMQYWQVLRHYGVSTKVDGIQLVCYVPLEIVRFLPAGHALSLPALPSGTAARAQLLARYGMLIRYHDVLERCFSRRPELMYGLRVLRSFAGNPTITVGGATGSAQNIIGASIQGTFLPFEQVHVTAVSKTGMRVGPIQMSPAQMGAIPTGLESRAALIETLRTRRRDEFVIQQAAIPLPDNFPPSELARLEFGRRFTAYSYRVSVPSTLTSGLSGLGMHHVFQFMKLLDVTLGPAELEQEIGGPRVHDPIAKIGTTDVIEAYNGAGGTDVMGTVLPVAAKRLAPELQFADLLKIEAVLQHVTRNTVAYSQAVWESLTPGERAIMLEPYTIGVPAGGVSTSTLQVPLLDCVANEVLGYFGNAAVMPFFIPPQLAATIGKTSRELEEALLKFHREGFMPARSSITLPTRGVLGEAILGSCTSCEKIDLTRFWNWQDSPPDEAGEPADLKDLFDDANSLVGTGGATVPTGSSPGSIVTVNTGTNGLSPAEIITSLLEKAPATSVPTDLTGASQLSTQMTNQVTATSASLKQAIDQATALASKAMTILPKVIGNDKDTTTADADTTTTP